MKIARLITGLVMVCCVSRTVGSCSTELTNLFLLKTELEDVRNDQQLRGYDGILGTVEAATAYPFMTVALSLSSVASPEHF